MNPLISLFLALCVGAAIVLVGYFALGLNRRAQLETAAGIAALNALMWRQFADLAIAYFRARGFEHSGREHRPGEGGFDLLLERDGKRHIAVLKLSSAYEFAAESVRELGSIVQTHGAASAWVVTTGKVRPDAIAAAARQRITILHGESLWREFAPLLKPDTVHDAIEQAHQQWRERLTKLGAGGVAAALVLFVAGVLLGGGAPAASTPAREPQAVVVKQAPAPVPAVNDEPGDKVKRPPNLSEAEESAHRSSVADEISAVDGVVSVGWSTKSTLVLALNGGNSVNRERIIGDVCARLDKFDELKLTRLQIHEFQPASAEDARVRWLQCRDRI